MGWNLSSLFEQRTFRLKEISRVIFWRIPLRRNLRSVVDTGVKPAICMRPLYSAVYNSPGELTTNMTIALTIFASCKAQI